MATQLEKKIMRRIYVLWVAKRVANPLMLKLYAFAALTYELIHLVSIRNVIANWPALADIGRETNFIAAAFMHTSLPAQAITLGMAAVAALLFRDLFHHENIGQFSFQLPLRTMQ